MTTVADILKCIETIAPRYMKMDWDNVGLNCGRSDREVKKVLVALDPFAHVCQEAKAWGADLLVTHHALLWKPGFITDGTVQGSNTLFLIENGIAHINAHTNFDCAPGGINDVLAATLDLREIQVTVPVGEDTEGRPYGLLRDGIVDEMPLEAFLEQVKSKLGTPVLRYADGGKPVRRVAVGGGSCADAMRDALRAGCDTLVTSDARYNQFWDARDLGINLIDAGHFYTENPACTALAQTLRDWFPEIEVKISETHTDCMKFY